MKTIIYIYLFLLWLAVFLLIFIAVNGQCPGTIKVPRYFHVIDTAHYWNYNEANGTVLWRNREEYDVSLIPPGGFISNGDYKKAPYIIKGFAICYVNSNCYFDSVLSRTDMKGKNIEVNGRIVHPAILPR